MVLPSVVGLPDDTERVGQQPTDDDPGWPSVAQVLRALTPGYLQIGSRKGDQLIALRSIFVSFSVTLVAFAVVLQLIGNRGPNHVLPWLWLLAVAAGLSITAIAVLTKPLDCSSEAKLAVAYRNRFFLTIASCESVALFGFVFAFIGAPTWIYDLGAAFALSRFWTVDPPTPRRLQQHQAALATSGCELSLVGALRRTIPPSPR